MAVGTKELPGVLVVGKSEFGVCGGVGGMTGIVMLANTMRLVRGRIAEAWARRNCCGGE